MRGDELIDERIDAALRSYAEPGEMPETRAAVARVMAQVELAESRKRFWMWAVGIPAVACLLMAVLVATTWWMRGSRQKEIAWVPKAPAVVRTEKREERVAVSELSHPGARKAAHQNVAPVVAAVQERLPMLDVFPTPRPLTAEEQALVAFVRRAPPAVRKAVIEDQQHWDDPIIVADLRKPSTESGNQQDQ
jgi:hypothetical protein